MGKQNYYNILGLNRKASNQEIRNAYHKLARLYHPDLHNEKKYNSRFIAINQAYSVLRDENSRKAYDFTLREEEEAKSINSKVTVTYGDYTPAQRSKTFYEKKPDNAKKPESIFTQVNPERSFVSKDFLVHYNLAKNAYRNRSYAEAMKEIDTAFKFYKKSAPAYELRGDIFAVYENYNEAVKNYKEALRLSGNSKKIQKKFDDCINKTIPEKKSFFSKLKDKFFESDE